MLAIGNRLMNGFGVRDEIDVISSMHSVVSAASMCAQALGILDAGFQHRTHHTKIR